MFKPTHTLEISGDLVEVRLQSVVPDYIWQDASGRVFKCLPNSALLIPGLAVEAETNLNQLMPKIGPTTPKVKHLPDDGLIVRANGKPWVIKSQAKWVLGQLGLQFSHTVDGYGNNSRSGRQWWIRPRRSMTWKNGWVDNGTDLITDVNYPYCIEANVFGCSTEDKKYLLWDLRRIRKEWNARLNSKEFFVLFQFEGDYLAFKKMVCRMV